MPPDTTTQNRISELPCQQKCLTIAHVAMLVGETKSFFSFNAVITINKILPGHETSTLQSVVSLNAALLQFPPNVAPIQERVLCWVGAFRPN